MSRILEFVANHPVLTGATTASLLVLIAYEIRNRGQAGMTVSTAQAVRLINQGATVVDVREGSRFSAAHIADAVNIAPAELTTEGAQSRFKKKRPLLVVCDSGARAARLAARLRQQGFEKAWALAGGLPAWQKENLPVVAERAPGK